MGRGMYWRPIWGFVGIDLASYFVLYALVLPPFESAIQALDPVILEATAYLLTALRLGFIGAITARWIRSKWGLESRRHVVHSILVAAVLSWSIQMLLTIGVDAAFGGWSWNWQYLLALGQWIVFSLMGALAVNPGQAKEEVPSMPLRFTVGSDRGAAAMFLVPTVAFLVAGALAVIVIMGGATNNRRSADTAADAAALAAGKVWKDTLHGKFTTALASADSSAFWGLAGSSIATGLPYSEMQAAAAEYAQRNDAHLVDLQVDQQHASVRVNVQHNDPGAADGKEIRSMAESALLFRSGLCNSWGVLGYKINGVCVTTAPPEPDEEPDPEDSEEDEEEPEEEPFELPNGLSNWNVDVVLSDAG